MSVEDKKKLLKQGSDFNRDNAEYIKFDPNIPVTVILPPDWIKDFKQEPRTFIDRDGNEKEQVYSHFKVMNPNAADPKKLRSLKATESLYSELNTVIEAALETGWNGPIMLRIEKKVSGASFGKWSVQGKEYKEGGVQE